MKKMYPYPAEKSLKLTYFTMSKLLENICFSKKWLIWYFLFGIITIYTFGVLLMIFDEFGSQNLSKYAKNGIFDFFGQKSHKFDSTSYSSTKMSQIWYHLIDNWIFYRNKPWKTNFQKMLKIFPLPLENCSQYQTEFFFTA